MALLKSRHNTFPVNIEITTEQIRTGQPNEEYLFSECDAAWCKNSCYGITPVVWVEGHGDGYIMCSMDCAHRLVRVYGVRTERI